MVIIKAQNQKLGNNQSENRYWRELSEPNTLWCERQPWAVRDNIVGSNQGVGGDSYSWVRESIQNM